MCAAAIHRDIKPTNVLVAEVDGEPVPKVIDFGLAKPFGTGLGVDAQMTVDGQVLGTPAYMSPEQASGSGDVDVPTNVYALGVLLYELLVGGGPWGQETLSRDNIALLIRRIISEDPPKPSDRLSTLHELHEDAAVGIPNPRAWKRRLRGDLDWIVMKALAKERERRYGSALELVEDVRRHLDDKPVHAGPPSAVYRLRKLIRRNRPVVIGMAAGLCVLVGGLIASLVLLGRADAAREKTERAFASEQATRAAAEGVIGFMLGPVVDDEYTGGRLQMMRSIAAEVSDYYGDVDPKMISTESALRIARALMTAGRALGAQRAEEAVPALDQAIGILKHHRRNSSRNPELLTLEIEAQESRATLRPPDEALAQIPEIRTRLSELEALRPAETEVTPPP